MYTFLFSAVTYGQKIQNDLSSWDKKRPSRKATSAIVVHTTEAGNQSSLNSLKKFGTANYLVTTDGVVHIIISDRKVAKHAGRSMWQNRSNLSESTIGIEVAGFHNKKPTAAQLLALKQLIAKLKVKYKLGDEKVLCHSMVAYGSPNKYHHFNHRGRKRCGMLFATKEIRQKLGLKNTFTSDPDVKAKRLKNADPYLAKVLYGSGKSVSSEKEEARVVGINEGKKDDEDAFEGFREIGKEGIYNVAGEEYKSSTTIYFYPDGKIRTGKEIPEKEFKNFPKGMKCLIGYMYGGKVSLQRTAYEVVGSKWNSPSTFYRFPNGNIKTGDDVEEGKLPPGIIVLFRK